MDTPTQLPLQAGPGIRSARWLRIAFFLGLLVCVQGLLAYLLSWVDPPRDRFFQTIHVTSNDRQLLPSAWVGGHQSLVPVKASSKTLRSQKEIRETLACLTDCGANQPAILSISAPVLQGESGQLFILPSDALPDDPSTWVRFRDILEALEACPSKQKLLVLDLAPPLVSAWRGYVYHDLGAAIPRELDAVPDAQRLVLCSCAPGQTPHGSAELGESVFAHYFQAGLRGDADGCGDLRDGHISVKELAAFVQARVQRWALRVRGESQTPVLLGTGSDFVIADVDANAARNTEMAWIAREHPQSLNELWQERDEVYRSGQFRLTPREFQYSQARLGFIDRNDGANVLRSNLGREHRPKKAAVPAETRTDSVWAPTRSQSLGMMSNLPAEASLQAFEERWRILEHKLADAKPADGERIKKRFVEDERAKFAEADLDAVVFAHAVADPRLDPGTLRLCDRLLHPTPQTPPRTAGALSIRQLADLAMRVEVQAWPRDLVDTLLRCTANGEKALTQTPYLPGYVDLLDEPALARHAGEVRLWTRGFSSLDEAKQRLTAANDQFERLLRLNDKWRTCEQALDEAMAELPWYFEALEALPDLRTSWEQAAGSARGLAETLKTTPDESLPWIVRVERLTTQLDAAEKHRRTLQEHRQALHMPFAKDVLARLERSYRSPQANARSLRSVEAVLSIAAPILHADQRASLWQAAQLLSRRLQDETFALDRQDNEAQRWTPSAEIKTPALEDESRRATMRADRQLVLLELAGVADEHLRPLRASLERCKRETDNVARWCDLGASFRRVMGEEMAKQYRAEKPWRERERLAWLMSPWDRTGAAEPSPTIEHRRLERERHARWLNEHHRYLARDYLGLNFESPGIVAARGFYARAVEKDNVKASPEAYVKLNVAASVEPLTEKQPYAHLWLEVTRHVPAGAFGPVDLHFHRMDDAWLEVAPGSALLTGLTEAKEPRTHTHKVPLKAMRKPKAERSGLAPPIGFLVEARFEGRSYHHLVNVPIVPSAQEAQILVSADPDEPGTTLNEIRVRPGRVKQPHYVYVKNLTNRAQKVHVEIKSGETFLHKSAKPMTLEPDGVRKLSFDETLASGMEVRGPIEVRVFDQERQKVLHEKSLRVEVLMPREYVKLAEATFEPGVAGNNRWAIQVLPAKLVSGPAIAAQLVLPVQRIPGLLSIGGGTMHVDVPTKSTTPRLLFAERLHLAHPVEGEGPVYLHVDGVARAFVYRTNFTRGGEPTQPLVDERPAVRLVAPPCLMSGLNCLVDLEVDNAPTGTTLEVLLGHAYKDGTFKADLVRGFADAKKRRIDVELSKDALVFAASIGDWTATFDTRSLVGPRTFEARLIDSAGKVITTARQAVILDDSPPIARIVPLPAQVKRGSVLQVQAEGMDPESGVGQVVFFLGRPDKGEIPLGATRVKAIPVARDQTLWAAALLIPGDHKGPLAISIQVVNNAGLSSVDTVSVEVIDHEPGKTGLGEIRGNVVEGPRVQPNLLVILTDERGKEVARTRTHGDSPRHVPRGVREAGIATPGGAGRDRGARSCCTGRPGAGTLTAFASRRGSDCPSCGQ